MNLEKYDSSLKCLDGVMYNYKIYTCLHSSIILHEAWGRGISYPFQNEEEEKKKSFLKERK